MSIVEQNWNETCTRNLTLSGGTLLDGTNAIRGVIEGKGPSAPRLTATPGLSHVSTYTGVTVTGSLEIRNNTPTALPYESLRLAGRLPEGSVSYDFSPYGPGNLAANAEATVTRERSFNVAGNYTFSVLFEQTTGSWEELPDESGVVQELDLEVKAEPLADPALSAASTYTGSPVTASFTIRNKSSQTFRMDSLKLVGRDPANGTVDFPGVALTLAPGASYTYEKTRTFSAVGQHRFAVQYLAPDNTWHMVPTSSGENPYFIYLDASQAPPSTITRNLSSGWHLLAGGAGSDCPSASLFGFNGSSYQSTTAQAMAAGKGYWARYEASATATLTTVAAPLTVHLLPGWNLIGNATSQQVSLPIGKTAFAFDGIRYLSKTTLEPGQGAWMKAGTEEEITLGL